VNPKEVNYLIGSFIIFNPLNLLYNLAMNEAKLLEVYKFINLLVPFFKNI
jgi:hypothetical protein